MATSDDRPRITLDSDNVQIQVVNERTARLAQQFITDATGAYLGDKAGGEPVSETRPDTTSGADGPGSGHESAPEPEAESESEPESERDDKALEERAAEEITLTATSGAPWEDYDDRDARVAAYIDARYDYEGGPFEVIAGEIADVLDANGMGISYSLRELEDYDARKTGKKEAGANVWRITEADGEADDEPDQADEVDADQDGDEADDVTAEDMPDLHGEQIEIGSRSGGAVAVDAVDVVDAIADSPTIYYLHGNLGTDKDAAEGLLHTLDLYDHFRSEAPLERSLVRETVAEFLGVDA